MTTVTVVEEVIHVDVSDGASPASVQKVADDLSAHEGDTENPHSVTAAQVGADESGSAATVAGALSDHAALSTTAHGGIVADSDSRLADARTPTAHAATHATDGDDPLTAADIGAVASAAIAGRLYVLNQIALSRPSVNTPAQSTIAWSADCTGTAASATISSADDLTLLGSGKYACVLQYASDYQYVMVTSVSGTDIVLEEAPESLFMEDLPSGTLDFTLYFRHTEHLAQHQTEAGNRALAQMVFDASSLHWSKESAMIHHFEGDRYETEPWTIRSPLYWQPYNGLANNDIAYSSSLNQMNSTSKAFSSVTSSTVRFGGIGSTADVGVNMTIPLNGNRAIAQFPTGIYSTAMLSGTVEALVDGVMVYSEPFSNTVKLHNISLQGNEAEIRVIKGDAVSGNYWRTGEFVLLPTSGSYPQLIQRTGKNILLGDSWFDTSAYPGVAAQLEELAPDSTVVDTYGVSGTTSTYGAAWIDYVIKQEYDPLVPSSILIHYGINDAQSIAGFVLDDQPDPDGNDIDINVDSVEEYRSNLNYIAQQAMAVGWTVVILTPPPTSSESQTQNLATTMSYGMSVPIILREFLTSCTNQEIGSVASVINVRRKYAGRMIYEVESGKQYYALGSSTASGWISTDGVTTITPS